MYDLEAAEINRVLLKEVEKPKYRPTKIVEKFALKGIRDLIFPIIPSYGGRSTHGIPRRGSALACSTGLGTGMKAG